MIVIRQERCKKFDALGEDVEKKTSDRDITDVCFEGPNFGQAQESEKVVTSVSRFRVAIVNLD